MITLILDGYNVIHAVPELSKRADQSLEAGRQALIDFCTAYKAKRGDVGQLYIVFDGDDAYAGQPSMDRQGVSVMFSRRGEEADERILSLIRNDGGRSRFVIVSNDTYIFNNARAHGARVISVRDFYAQRSLHRDSLRSRAADAPWRKRTDTSEKAPLSSGEAQRITDEYRKHLEGK